ncbi:MAG TPA: response regulator [Rhodanobacter sp.]
MINAMKFEAGKRVLVVEDDPVVAMVVEDTLLDMGLEVLIDLSLIDAVREVEGSTFDAALVDLGLRGENARPVILALLEKNVPFAVMSGGDLSALAAEFPHIQMMSKPLDMKTVRKVVVELLDASPSAHAGA